MENVLSLAMLVVGIAGIFRATFAFKWQLVSMHTGALS